MQLNDVVQLAKLLDKSGLTEISFSDETSQVVLKKELLKAAPAPTQMVMHAPAPVQAAPVASAAASPAPPPPASKFKDITSPMVGTFYASATPGGAPIVQVGSAVKAGEVICIIEAMKIMNEIESDFGGVIEEICATNETPVEYGTVLFRIRPS